MKLTDEQVAHTRDNAYSFGIPAVARELVSDLATEVLESRALLENAHIGIAVSAHKAEIEALEKELLSVYRERDEANAAAEAHEAKWRSICKAERSDGGMCACSYDKPDDVCAFHSPKLAAAEARVAELEALLDVDRLEEIITDSIDLDWTPRDAAKAIVRAMGGDGT